METGLFARLNNSGNMSAVCSRGAGETPRKRQTDCPMSEGVRVGVGVKMPRVPAVNPRTRRWRPRKHQDPRRTCGHVPTQGVDNDECRQPRVWKQQSKMSSSSLCAKGKLCVTPKRKQDNCTSTSWWWHPWALWPRVERKRQTIWTVRLLFDGTHGAPVNWCTCVSWVFRCHGRS